MKKFQILALAMLPLLAACGDSTSPNTSVSGSLSFTYTGGSFSASGAIAATASATTSHTTQWAAGAKVAADNSTLVMANVPTTGGLANSAVITINRQTVGAATANSSCTPTSTVSCTMLFLLIGATENGTAASICYMETGTITIGSISNSNATGTFSGVGVCINSTTFASTAFTVSNGAFNVPLIATVPSG